MPVGRRSPSRALRTISFGTPSPPGGPVGGRREHRGEHPAADVNGGAAGVAASHLAAKRGHPAAHRTATVGVLADHLAGAADPCRGDRRAARSPDSRAPLRRRPWLAARAAAPARRAVDAEDRQVVARLVVDRRCVQRRARRVVTVVSSSPATTCALVTTSPEPATHPDPSTPSPQAVPRTLTTLSPARCTSGSVAIARSGARTVASGPGCWPWVDVPEHVQHRPRRRQDVVQLARIGSSEARDAGPARRARASEGHGTEDPGDASARAPISSGPASPSARRPHTRATTGPERVAEALHTAATRRRAPGREHGTIGA